MRWQEPALGLRQVGTRSLEIAAACAEARALHAGAGGTDRIEDGEVVLARRLLHLPQALQHPRQARACGGAASRG